MPCGQGNYYAFDRSVATTAPGPLSAVVLTSPHLLVSNSPEHITAINLPLFDDQTPPQPTYTLFKGQITAPGGAVVRSFIWHWNDSDQIRWIVLSAYGDSRFKVESISYSTAYVPQANRIDQETWGLCLAKTHLFSSYDVNGAAGASADVGEVKVWSAEVPGRTLVGAVLEFSVSGDNVWIRSPLSGSDSLQGSISDRPALGGDGHVRGLWPYSAIEVQCQGFDAKPVQGPHEFWTQCGASGGPEESAFPPMGPYDTVNRGLYGVNILYHFNLTNSGQFDAPAWFYAVARNVPTAFYGAGHVTSPPNYDQRGIPPLFSLVGYPRAVDLLNVVDGSPIPINVHSGSNVTLDWWTTFGGGCSLPFDLVLSGIAFEPAVPPGG